MKLQNILFPSQEACMTEDMYFRIKRSRLVRYKDNCIHLLKDSGVSFDTYFNSFSAEKWFKYTNVQTIKLTLKIKGNLKITLQRKEKFGNTIDTECIYEQNCVSEHPGEFTFEYDTDAHNGVYCFTLKCEEGEAFFYGGYYYADIPREMLRQVKIAVDICTFKREKFVERNLNLLKKNFLDNPDSEMFETLEVFISDNGGTLDSDRLANDKIHIFKNKNTGGAGGFTRGLIEINNVKKEKNITHALLMDDDILIDSEAVFRTFAILSCIKEKYSDSFIGGSMIRLDQRFIQTESGAAWLGGNIVSLKCGLDLRKLCSCLQNEIEEYTQYNAWWYCAFPMDIVKDDNLPLPVFIRGDDVEYGLRNMKHLILMNGICVWHEPFERKYSSSLFYYILRNRLIDNSIHNMSDSKKTFVQFLENQVMEQIRLYRYKNANLLIQGAEDFLKGVEWFMQQDGEALHKTIMNEGYKLVPVDELKPYVPFLYARYEDSVYAANPATLKYKFLRKFTTNGIFFLPSQKRRIYNVIPVDGAKDINVYRTEKVLNYDAYSKKGFITSKDTKTAKLTIKRMKKLKKALCKNYDKAVKDYAENGKKLMTKEFWKRYLGLDNYE